MSAFATLDDLVKMFPKDEESPDLDRRTWYRYCYQWQNMGKLKNEDWIIDRRVFPPRFSYRLSKVAELVLRGESRSPFLFHMNENYKDQLIDLAAKKGEPVGT